MKALVVSRLNLISQQDSKLVIDKCEKKFYRLANGTGFVNCQFAHSEEISLTRKKAGFFIENFERKEVRKMKKWAILLAVAMLLIAVVPVLAGKPDSPPGQVKKDDVCTTIQDQVLTYSTSTDIIPLGFDKWGYNYQGLMFNGWYWNNTRPEPAYTKDTIDKAPSKTWLIMKWSDEWLSNKDCNDDGKLDRGYSCDPVNANSSACDGSWLTNHQFGSYEEDGETCYWNYFVKMVYVNPDNAYTAVDSEDGVNYWYTNDGEKIGSVIWGAYARILQISNDPCAEEHGVLNKFETPAGFGFYK